MGCWQKAVCVCFWALLFAVCGITAQAAGFSPSLSSEEGEPGDVVEISITYDGSLGEVAAFRASVEYDPAVLEYLRPTYGESVREGTVTTVSALGKVESVFTADKGAVLAAGEGITYRFRVAEGAAPGKSSLFVSVFEISSPEPSPLGNDTDVSFDFLVPEPPSSDARLVYLAPDVGELEPGFSPGCLGYTMTVPYEVDAITFIAEPVAGAVCRVNRKNLGSGGSDTVFEITVTAEDGETKNVYQVTVHRQEKEEEEKPNLSDDARLLSLTPQTGTLTPAFSPDVFEYSLTVPYEVTTMAFEGKPVEGATYRVNRKNLGSGGSNTLFEITVTAEDEETKNVYQVTVHRQEKEEEEKPALSDDARLLSLVPQNGALTPAFSPNVYEYSLTVPYEITTMTFEGEPVEGATYRVNRKNLGSGGSDTVFEITVTAEDGETKAVYQVTVHRNEKVKTSATEKPSSTTGAGGTPEPSPTAKAASEDPTGQNGSPRPGQEALVMAATGDSGNTGGGGDGAPPSGVSGVTFQNGNASLVPGMLALLAFVLFCFLSGPIAKSLASRFPGKQQSEETPSEKL